MGIMVYTSLWEMQDLYHLRTLSYGNYGIYLIMGNARFISATVLVFWILSLKKPL